jgi:hypothetical protein
VEKVVGRDSNDVVMKGGENEGEGEGGEEEGEGGEDGGEEEGEGEREGGGGLGVRDKEENDTILNQRKDVEKKVDEKKEKVGDGEKPFLSSNDLTHNLNGVINSETIVNSNANVSVAGHDRNGNENHGNRNHGILPDSQNHILSQSTTESESEEAIMVCDV